jgi:hypothetical protein
MSIEQKIEALTQAIEKLTAMIGGSTLPQPAREPELKPMSEHMAAEDAKVSAKLAAEKAKPAAPKVETPKPEVKVEAPAAAPALTYDDVKKAVGVLAVNPGGRQRVIAALSRFGVAKAPELNPDQWAEFVAMIQGTEPV